MNLSHQHVLEVLLSNNCPYNIIKSDEGTEILEFYFELHCLAFRITAKSLGWDEENSVAHFEILGYKVDIQED